MTIRSETGFSEFGCLKIGGVGDAQHRAGAAGPAQFRLGGYQHFCRYIQPEQPRMWETIADQRQIAAGAAADFQNAGASWNVELADQRVAAEQIIFAGKVVEMPLGAIHPVHAVGMAAACTGLDRRHAVFL